MFNFVRKGKGYANKNTRVNFFHDTRRKRDRYAALKRAAALTTRLLSRLKQYTRYKLARAPTMNLFSLYNYGRVDSGRPRTARNNNSWRNFEQNSARKNTIYAMLIITSPAILVVTRKLPANFTIERRHLLPWHMKAIASFR